MNNPYTPKAVAVAIIGVLAPLIVAFAAFLANEAQVLFHMDLEGPALAAYISAFLLVALAAGIKLLEHFAKTLIADAVRRFEKLPRPPVAGATVPPGPGEGIHQ